MPSYLSRPTIDLDFMTMMASQDQSDNTHHFEEGGGGGVRPSRLQTSGNDPLSFQS